MPEYVAAVSYPLGTGPNHGSQPLEPWKFFSPVVPLLIFLVLAVAIAGVGMVIFEQYRHNMQQAVQKELFGITDAKVKQFLTWRDERHGDAGALMNDDSFRAEFQHWVKNGMADDARRKRLLQRLVAIRDAHGFEDILLYDKTPALALSTNPDALPDTSFGMNMVSQVLRGGNIEHSDLHYLCQDGREHVRLGILAPLRPPGADAGPPGGVVLLRTNPTKTLFPALQAWPMPTQSGETFLAKHEGNSIIYLSELRHRKAQGMATRFSITEEKLLAAQAARGKEGFLEGEDYRGAAVIGAARLIPGTSWLIVSKIDKEEIYAPIRRTGWVVGIVTLLFVSMAGITTAIWWRNQRNALLAGIYQTRLMHESTKQRLENVSKYTNDIIAERKQAEAALIESQQQLRSLSVHQEGLLEEERKHIAREVHDELGQLLTALKMDISLLRLRFGQDPSLLEKLEGMRTLVEKTIHVVRQVASNLRPAALDLGLVPAIEWLAKDFSQRWNISCDIDMSGDEIALDDVTATTVFRVVQESLTNVARYAHASEVAISLQCGNRLLLRVEDNGCGFDQSALSKLPGLGLFGMRERIQALGGTLKIDSGSGTGTKLAIELPFFQGDSI